MTSLTVFQRTAVWWLGLAGIIGALHAAVMLGLDALLDTRLAPDRAWWLTIVVSIAIGLLAGAPVAAANAGMGLLGRPWSTVVPFLSRALATVSALWFLRAPLGATDSVPAQVVMVILVVGAAWWLAGVVLRLTRPATGANIDDDAPTRFEPTHILTQDPASDDVNTFVRASLRSHGRGNALFTVQAGHASPMTPHQTSTQILVDPRGTGHALDLGSKGGELADRAESMPGFVLSDDRTIAIAPAGLSASAVVSEGIGLIQAVAGTDDVTVRFEGYGH